MDGVFNTETWKRDLVRKYIWKYIWHAFTWSTEKWLIRNNVTYPLAPSSSSWHFRQSLSQRSRPAISYGMSALLSSKSNVLGLQLCYILKSHVINSAMSVHTTNYCRSLPQVPHGTPNHRNFHSLPTPKNLSFLYIQLYLNNGKSLQLYLDVNINYHDT